MKFAIAVTRNRISGPGEAEEIRVYEMGSTAELLESYDNPALTATSARGISMIKSVVDRDVDKLVISGIGDHAMQYASGKVELLSGMGMSVDSVLSAMIKGELKPITRASHSMNHGHH